MKRVLFFLLMGVAISVVAICKGIARMRPRSKQTALSQTIII